MRSLRTMTTYGRMMEHQRELERRRAERAAYRVDTVHRFQPSVYWSMPDPATAQIQSGKLILRIHVGRGPAACGVAGMALVSWPDDAHINCADCLARGDS